MSTAPVSGQLLGDRYELRAQIGSGSSAEVFQATDIRLGRDVAVKRLRSGFANDPRFLKLFRAEAQLAAQLSHPNLLTVFDWSDDPETGPFIVTELLGGGTLRSLLNRTGVLTPAQVAEIGCQAAQGLAFAHEQGLVHRDIKPANLLFGRDERVHIADFGIARAVAQAAWTEPEGVLIGTARYAAPEQATDGAIDRLADVYSLGLCLMEALTGNVPLERENALQTMVVRQTTDVPVAPLLADFAPDNRDAYDALLEPLALAGQADSEHRSTAAELLSGLLQAVHDLDEPAPLPLEDITFSGPGPVGVGVGEKGANGRHSNGRVRDPADDGEPVAEEMVIDPEAPTLSPAAGAGQADTNRRDGSALGRLVLPTGRRRWLWLAGLVAFVGLCVAAVYAGVVIRQAQPELATVQVGLPTFTVDDFSAMTQDQVQEIAAGYAWSVEVTTSFADGTEPGDILSQSPEPGFRLAPGESIAIEVSEGPVLHAVPEIVGMTRSEAVEAIESMDLVVGPDVVEVYDEDVDADVVMEATTDGEPVVEADLLPTGTVIDLTVSRGPQPRTVPSLVGLAAAQAEPQLKERDLVANVVEAYSETVPEGEIIATDPAADTEVSRGATVDVTVSLGRPFITVPEVVGLPAAEAADILANAGFTVGDTDGPANGTVISTDPAEGTSHRSGTEIRIFAARS